MQPLPNTLYRADQVRALDRIAIERFQIPGSVLMERAGAAAFEALRELWPDARRVAVVCGPGNNGGDGFVLGRLAHEAGLHTDVFQVGDAERLRGDALSAAQRLQGAGLRPLPFPGDALSGYYDVVVDALLGTGLRGEVQGAWRAAIEAVNRSGAAVLALDVPSGLHADTGQRLGAAVQASACITFIGIKRGLVTGAGPACCGRLLFDDLRVPAEVYAGETPAARRLDWAKVGGCLAPRARDAHKGMFGHVLVVGGDAGMGGAARMAGEAAARVGAGLVSIATRPQHAAALSAARPELMAHGIDQPAELAPLLARATVVAIGPGLGQSRWAAGLLGRVLDADRPLVLDADALNLLCAEPLRREDWILTPHPGEAGRLLDSSAHAVQADRYAAAAALVERFGGVAVLKGAGTVVQTLGSAPAVCAAGNPGMASGGMGDVLTGVLAGLIAQGLALPEAAELGVCLHATAADCAARDGERGMLAGDLLPWLRRLANPGRADTP